RVDELHVLENPSLIWPGLRLKLPTEAPSTAEGELNEPPVTNPNGATLPPAHEREVVEPWQQSIVDVVEPTPVPAITTENTDVVATSTTSPSDESEPVPTVTHGNILEIGAAAVGLGGAVWLALKTRRRVREPSRPESDTELDDHAFSRAAPGAVLAARRDGR